jgi:hypothetical protein
VVIHTPRPIHRVTITRAKCDASRSTTLASEGFSLPRGLAPAVPSGDITPMRRPWYARIGSAFLSLWFVLCVSEPVAAMHRCPMHDGVAGVMAMPNGQMMGGAAQTPQNHDQPPAPAHHDCTCKAPSFTWSASARLWRRWPIRFPRRTRVPSPTVPPRSRDARTRRSTASSPTLTRSLHVIGRRGLTGPPAGRVARTPT